MRYVIGLGLACVMSAVGCAQVGVPVRPPPGFIYARIKAPISINANATQLGSKVGTSRTQMIRDIFITGQGIAWGDASVASAAKSAGITVVHHIDYEMMSVLGIYVEFTTIVYGD